MFAKDICTYMETLSAGFSKQFEEQINLVNSSGPFCDACVRHLRKLLNHIPLHTVPAVDNSDVINVLFLFTDKFYKHPA